MLWSAPPAAGFTPQGIFQAVPTDAGPSLYSVQAAGTQTLVQAFTSDGQQMWQTTLAATYAGAVPDGSGGMLVTGACDSTNNVPMSLADVDRNGVTQWQIQFPTMFNGQLVCPANVPKLAIRQDGAVVAAMPLQMSPRLYILDGSTGASLANPAIPVSTVTDGFGNVSSCDCLSPVGQPIVDSDGSIYVEYETRTIAYPPRVTAAGIFLLKVAADGTTSSTQLSTTSADQNLFPGTLIPDGNGGVLATWIIDNSNPPVAPQPYQAADILGGAVVASYPMPNAPANLVREPSGLPIGPAMVLGENGTAFASYGTNAMSFQLTSGSTNWNYQAPAQTSLTLIASEAGNGLAAKSTNPNGLETVTRFDVAGVPAADLWSGSHLQYWAGTLFPGGGSSGILGYFGNMIQFSASGWLAPDTFGTNEAALAIHVTNASDTGPNQAQIVSIFGKIKNALNADASSGHPVCSSWLQAGPATIDLLLTGNDPAHPTNNFGHGVFDEKTAAFHSGTRNADGSPIGIPGNWSITVNDGGAFFSSTNGSGKQFLVGKRQYAGNTLKAQATILIHELAHVLSNSGVGAAGFQSDFGIRKAGQSNDALVDQNCRSLIEGLQ